MPGRKWNGLNLSTVDYPQAVGQNAYLDAGTGYNQLVDMPYATQDQAIHAIPASLAIPPPEANAPEMGDPDATMRDAYAEQERRLGPMRLPSEVPPDEMGNSTGPENVSSGNSDFSWLAALGGAMQSGGAAWGGNYNVPQQYMQLGQQRQEMMAQAEQRKQAFAHQQAQLEEQKNQHHMQMVEKLIQTGNIDALNAYGKQYAPAGLIGQAMGQRDLAEVPSLLKEGYLEQDFVKSIFDQDPTKRPTPGQIKAHVDFAKEMFKEDYKAGLKNKALDRALAKPAEQRSPGEQRLVDDHQTEMDLKKAQSFEHEAKGIKALDGDGEAKLSYGIDRVAIAKELYNKSPKDLSPDEMGVVNQKYKDLQGFLAGERANASQTAQLNVPDKLPPQFMEKLLDDVQAVQHIENLKNMYDASKIGRVRGNVGTMLEFLGQTGGDESTLRAEIDTLKNSLLRARSGLNVTEIEQKRMDREVPDITNSPSTFVSRLLLTEKNMRALATKRRELYKTAGYDTSRLAPLEGTEGKASKGQLAQAPATNISNPKPMTLDEWKKVNGY